MFHGLDRLKNRRFIVVGTLDFLATLTNSLGRGATFAVQFQELAH